MGQGEFVGSENFVDVLGRAGTSGSSCATRSSIFLLSSVPQVVVAIVIAALLD